MNKKKCSSKDHEEMDAISYCEICKIFICNKCEIIHSKLFQSHQTISLDKNLVDKFTGFCLEKKHGNELEFFCKDHNQLICSTCICKIRKNEIGNHKDCNVCTIEEIKDEKINKLKENIKCLEELYITLEESMNNIKKIFEKINKNKEELKIKIQKEFTSLRNALNIREDELLLEVDKKFKDNFIGEEFLKESEKFPHKIKLSLENGKKIDNENKNNKLNLMIYDCIRIENNINEINNIKENINKFNNFNNFNIEFGEESNKIIEILNNMGKIKEKGEIIIKNSSIINDDDINKQNIIINWIKEKVNKNAIKFELIFKMSENGSNSKDFHKYCDNKGPTLTLVKTKKNYNFGGFTPLEWKNKGGSIYDKSNKTFIFSFI